MPNSISLWQKKNKKKSAVNMLPAGWSLVFVTIKTLELPKNTADGPNISIPGTLRHQPAIDNEKNTFYIISLLIKRLK